MIHSPLLFEEISGKEGSIGLITLNRPHTLNALTHEMIILLHQKLLEWEKVSHIKAVLIRPVKGRAFCAGGDLRLVYEKYRAKDLTLSNFFYDEYRLNHYIFHYTKPYISFLDGITMGGGAGISLNGSHCIGTENLLFAMPETGIGFFPDVGGTYFLSRLIHGIGFYLGLTGVHLSCDDCLDIQLIKYKIPQANLPWVIKTLTETSFSNNSHETVSHILNQFHQPTATSLLHEHYSQISHCFLNQTMEEIIDALKNDMTPWGQQTVDILKNKSPTSLKVTLSQLQKGVKRDFDQCMQMEYLLMSHFIQHYDFFEGIRALIIEKDRCPHWKPSQLSEISQEDTESFFIPFEKNDAPLVFS